ncbi:doublecortin [Babesia caballi]|uniref:Doublecortin n=1 Tax=Babesia caballi TaxID=5871 RepID=A0AAV4LXA7_BABCB|nr:doublecortin [Babesia caballi]
MAKFLEFFDPELPTPSAYAVGNFTGRFDGVQFPAGYDDGDTPTRAGGSRRYEYARTHFDVSENRASGANSRFVNLYDSTFLKSPAPEAVPHLLQTFRRSHRSEHAPQLKPRDVFERLTDHRFFTGTHRERFDEHGNGRGLAGREDVYIYDGNTESASRVHEVYSTVMRRPHAPVLQKGTLGVQKYGVQVATPKLMWLYRNGDKFDDGTAFYVRPFIKTMDILFLKMADDITLIAGPIRRIYDQNLRLVTSVEEIVDGAKYLCTSGEPPAPPHRLQKFMSEWVVQRFGH